MRSTFSHPEWGWIERQYYEFHPGIAHFAVGLAKDSYRNDERFGMTMKKRGFDSIQSFVDQNLLIIIGRKRIRTATQEPGMLYAITFRGTDDIGDVIGDFDVRMAEFALKEPPAPGLEFRVHQGAFGMIKRFEARMHDVIFAENEPIESLADVCKRNTSSNAHFLVCGHSLGGGLATLFGLRLIEEYGQASENVAVYTFGSLPVVNKDIADLYQDSPVNNNRVPGPGEKRWLNLHRFVNTDDPLAEAIMVDRHSSLKLKASLPTLPFASMGLHHLGTEYQFNPRIIPDFNDSYMQRFGRPYSPKKVVDAHMMAGYGIGTTKILDLITQNRAPKIRGEQ